MGYTLSASLAAFSTLLLATLVNGLAITYCSSENTAGDFQAIYSQYQSNGLCQNSCGDYAYAILQGGDCWCSDYAPSDQVNTYDCDEQCPGYPFDWCGSPSAGLYGYYQLSDAPSGTAGGATTPTSASVSSTSSTAGPSSLSSSSSSSSSANSSPTRSSVIVPIPVSLTASSISATSSSSIYVPPSTSPARPQSTATGAQTSISSPPSTTDQPTQVYTSVMTVTGQVKTIVVTPTSLSDPSSLGQGATSSGGVSTGKVVGIVLGVALGLGLLIGLAVWLWLRRKHQNQSRASSQNGAYAAEDGDPSRTTPSRQVSQISSSGLLGRGPRIVTAGYGPSNSNSTNPRSPDTLSSNGIDRRSLGTDQRLNPYALYAHEEARMSSVSLQDNQDYSRQLRIANPD